MITVKKNEATAAYRRMFFQITDATDGMTPETGEADGQPQVSVNGDAFGTQAIIGVLVAIGNGRYYAELTQAGVNIADRSVIEGRYKSANTAEAVGTTVQIREFPVDASVAACALASVCTEGRLAELDAANLITDVANVKTDTAAILVDTAEIGTAGAGLTNINLPNQTMDIVGNITGNLSGSVGSVTGDTPQTGDLYGLMTSADTELSAVPSTAGTIINKIKFLFQYFRNKKTVTGATETLFKEDASTALGTSTLSDDGTTVTKGETS